MIGLSTRGPIYRDDYERGRHGRLVRSALTEIADALGDVDGFAGRYSDEERADPAIAAADCRAGTSKTTLRSPDV